MTYFVAPTGDDAAPGTLQRPFASPARASRAMRAAVGSGAAHDVTVELRGGTYRLNAPLIIGPHDGPPAPYRVTFRNHGSEEPILSGARPVTGWRRLEENVPALPEVARGNVWVAEVPGLDCRCLFAGARRLPRARTRGFVPATRLTRAEWSAARERGADAAWLTELHYPAGAIAEEDDLAVAEVVIRPMWPWVVNYLPVAEVDRDRRVIRTALPATYPQARLAFDEDGLPTAWIENTLAGITGPGRWALDRMAGRLYLWPPSDGPPQAIEAPHLTELVRVAGEPDGIGRGPARGIHFEGITFIHGDRELWRADEAGLQHDWDLFDRDNALLRLRNAERCTVRGCHFHTSGGGAIRLDLHAQDNLVAGNLIENVGGTGVLLCGYGPGVQDVNRRNTVVDNVIHHCGRIHWHAPGVFVWQSGENRIARNLIHHLAYNAVVISGVRPGDFRSRSASRRECTLTIRWDEVGAARDWHRILPFLHARNNVFEENEIHHAMQYLGDGNAVYVSGCGEGNIIRRNYIHDMEAATTAQAAIRTDGWQRGTLVSENVIVSCACGVMRKNYNHVENNVIVDARADLGAIAFRHFPEDEQTSGSRVQRNICVQRRESAPFYAVREFPPASGRFTKPVDCHADFNLFYNLADPADGERFLARMRARKLDAHSLAADPRLNDFAVRGLVLAPDSPAYALGFKPVDLSRIGLGPGFPDTLRRRYSGTIEDGAESLW